MKTMTITTEKLAKELVEYTKLYMTGLLSGVKYDASLNAMKCFFGEEFYEEAFDLAEEMLNR